MQQQQHLSSVSYRGVIVSDVNQECFVAERSLKEFIGGISKNVNLA